MTNQRLLESGVLFALSPPVAERQGYFFSATSFLLVWGLELEI